MGHRPPDMGDSPIPPTAPPPNPEDIWVEVTAFGAAEPEFILAQSGRDRAVARARQRYLNNDLTIEQFEQELDNLYGISTASDPTSDRRRRTRSACVPM